MKFAEFFRRTDFFKPALAALLLALSRHPLHLGWLVFFGFIPLFSFFAEIPGTRRIFKAAVVFAVIYNIVALHWISLATLGGFLGLFILFSLYFFLLFFLIGLAWKHLAGIRLPAFLCFWMSFEYLQNFGEFRFAWFNVGYSLADYLPFIQPAELGGIYLLSVLIITANFLIWKFKTGSVKYFILLSILIVLWAGFGYIRLKTIDLIETDTKISLVQVSIPQEMKWEESFLDTTLIRYEKFTRLAADQKADLIIWPESALPVYTLRNKTYRDFVINLARELKTDIFLGMPHYKFVGEAHPNRYEFYNSATLFSKTGFIYPFYIKNFVVPFGERMPFLKYLPFLWNVHFGQANWEYGTKQEFYVLKDQIFSPLICFEIAFEPLTSKMAKQGVDFIVNITNDAWFHRSAGTYQHAVMAKFRAVETRRPVYRCANTGFSLIVSPTGEYLQISELFEKTVLTQNLITCRQNSFFTKYLSQYPFVFVAGAGIILLLVVVRKQKETKKSNPVILSKKR